MGFFYEVLCEAGGSAEVAPCCHVFFIVGGELAACLSDICFVTVGTSQFCILLIGSICHELGLCG